MSYEIMKETPMFLLLLLVAVFSFFDGGSAKADQHVAAVQCDGGHNRVLIRFGMNGGYYSEIPDSLSAQWRDIPTQEDFTDAGIKCLFKDGQKIFISESTDVDMNTIGGGDVGAYFKMTIDGHVVYDDMQVYEGHMISIYDVSAVEYKGRALLECNPHEISDGMGHITANPTCYDESVRLSPGEDFLSDQELSTAKDEQDSPGSYDLPGPTGAISPTIYADIRTDEIEHRYADAVRDETVLFGLRLKYTPNLPPGPTEYNMRCWDRAHTPNLTGALRDCQTAIVLLKSHRFIHNVHETESEADYEHEWVADIYDSTGYVYLKLKLPTKAIYYYSRALSMYPKLASSLYGRALAEQARGQTAAAATDFAAAKTIDPKITSDFGA